MLKISLKHISQDGRNYVVFLGRGNAKKFNNKRKAEDFLRQVNKRLNETYLFISEEYVVAEGIFREMYLHICSYQSRFALQNSLDFLRNRLTAIPNHPDTENKNFFVINMLEGCLLELLSVYREMVDKGISRSNVAMHHRCNMRCHVVTLVAQDFSLFEREVNIESNIKVEYRDLLKVV